MRERLRSLSAQATFQALGRVALVFCSGFQLVLRRSPRTAKVLDALERLRPFLEDSNEQSEWPGTRLLPGKAKDGGTTRRLWRAHVPIRIALLLTS